MAKEIVTLYIDDSCVRVLVTRGKQIKKWADLPLEPGLVKNRVVIKEAEVSNKVKQLFKVLKVRSKKVVVGVSGLNCLTRPISFPHIPGELLEEAVMREAKRTLPVPPEQLYLSWQTIPAPPGKTQVFLVAIPQKMADAMLKTLRGAGLKPYLMELKPLALARATREATSIIVDVQPAEFDIVITADGVSQPVRTLPLTGEQLSSQERLSTIRSDLERTIEFYNANNPEKPLDSSVPIYVSGELANEPEQCQFLSNELGRPVLPMSPPLECSGIGLDPNHYMANMGLVLKEMPSGKDADPLVANVNVLPAPYQTKPVSLVNIVAPPAAVIALGFLAFLILLIQTTSADITKTSGQLSTTEVLLQQKLSQKQELTGKITEMEKNITEAEASGNNFAAALGILESEIEGANYIEVVVNNLPHTMTLTNISYAESTLTIDGRTSGEGEVLSYLRELDNTGSFSEIMITNLMENDDGEMDFTLVLKGGE